jgi:hypothetical protein
MTEPGVSALISFKHVALLLQVIADMLSIATQRDGRFGGTGSRQL